MWLAGFPEEWRQVEGFVFISAADRLDSEVAETSSDIMRGTHGIGPMHSLNPFS